MKCFFTPSWQQLGLAVLLSFLMALPQQALAAKSAVKLQKWSGTIDFSDDGPSPFTLAGNASHLGNFTAEGEVTFGPVANDGSMVGEGVVVFKAANGDLLVGTVTWNVDTTGGEQQTTSLSFHWADSVTFGNGDVVSSTGHFEDDRPPGLVVIAIIAILIGLLLPASAEGAIVATIFSIRFRFFAKGLAMKLFTASHAVRLIVLGICISLATGPAMAAKSAVKMTKLDGTVDLSADGPTPFTLTGIASHLGKYEAVGEVEFVPGEEEGSLVGEGVVVFKAANGDLLVGAVSWDLSPAVDDVRTVQLHFVWRDSVAFSDGTVAVNTGRFVDDRPPGLVVDAKALELAILIARIILGR